MRWQSLSMARTLTACLMALGLMAISAGELRAQGFAGVYVDANNTLHVQTVPDQGGLLMRERVAAARAQLNPDVAKASELRKVSLNRLEAALEARIAAGQEATDEMLYLAGLQRISYVFFYPETKDIVIAGPAEGWVTDPVGRVVGINNAQPTVHLEDLVTALRAFPAGQKNDPLIGCSIDPTQEGLQRLQQFLARTGRTATPRDTQFLVRGTKESLGLQTVTVLGIPANTRFAQVLVEADYRMKLIGIGLERPQVRMATYVDLVNPAAVAANAMQRWFFTPDYQSVRVTEDGNALQMIGQGVKLVSEDELVAASGERAQAATSNPASDRFVKNFSENYEAIAQRTPVYAELRTMIDVAIAAAFIQQQDYYTAAGWKPLVFANEKLFPVETCDTPKHVESAVNAIWRGNRLMTPVGGGVEIEPRLALSESNRKTDEDGSLAATREKIELNLAEGQWWWD